MKLHIAFAAAALLVFSGCDRGTAPRADSATNAAPVADKPGEKPTVQSGSTGSARAERGSGTTATNSGGTTTGSGPESTGSKTR